MKKVFNKKIAKLYIVLLCVTLTAGIVSSGFCISYSAQFDKATEVESDSSEILNSVVSALAGDSTSLSEKLATAIIDLTDGSEEEEKLSDEAQELQNKKVLTMVLLIAFFVLTAVFFAGTITCYEYEKYLESPKYKAKLKRLKKVEKLKTK